MPKAENQKQKLLWLAKILLRNTDSEQGMTCGELIEAIREKVASGFAEDEDAKVKRDYYFAYVDDENSKRTYEFLRKEGY